MLKVPTQPQPIAKVMSQSFKLYGYCFLDALPFSLALSMVIQIPFLGYGQADVSPHHFIFNPVNSTGLPGTILRFADSLIVNLPLTLFGIILLAGMIARMNSAMTHKTLTLTDGFSIGVRNLPQLFLLTIVYEFLSSIGFILLAAVFFSHGVVPENAATVLQQFHYVLHNLRGAFFMFLMLLMFLSVPSLYFSIAVAFCFGNLLVFHQNIQRAIRQSLVMAWGHFWRITTVLSIPLTIYVILFVLCGFAVRLILGPQGMHNKADVQSMFSIFITLLNTIMLPCVTAFYLTQLYDLKSRHSAKETLAKLSS